MSAAAPDHPSAPPGARRRIVLRNELDELERLRQWLEELARDFGLPPHVAFAADLCLHEAVGNVINHGFVDGASHEIEVSATRAGPQLVLEVEDDARPFDPLTMPTPEMPGRLEDVRIGGLGIHLIRQFAAQTRYAREGGRNRLTMIVGGGEAAP